MGHLDAQRMVAECSQTGYGTHVNKDKAEEWYLTAARKGDKKASSLLSKLQNSRVASYLDMSESLSDSHEILALKLVKAASKGDVQAMYEVGLLLGEDDEGAKFLKKAADRNHVQALCVLGNIAEKNGDYKLASEYFSKAFYFGKDATAAFNLGILYDNGLGVDCDPKRAEFYYLKAAKAGDSDAAYNYACTLHSKTRKTSSCPSHLSTLSSELCTTASSSQERKTLILEAIKWLDILSTF